MSDLDIFIERTLIADLIEQREEEAKQRINSLEFKVTDKYKLNVDKK